VLDRGKGLRPKTTPCSIAKAKAALHRQESARPAGRVRDRSPDGEGTRPASPPKYAAPEFGASAERHMFTPAIRVKYR
jgi:hypothetical protein